MEPGRSQPDWVGTAGAREERWWRAVEEGEEEGAGHTPALSGHPDTSCVDPEGASGLRTAGEGRYSVALT